MAILKWTHEAEASLRDIYDYIARDRPGTAERTLESLLHRLESIRSFPQAGQPYAYLGDGTIQMFSYGQFQVAYCHEDSGDVTVLAVFHGLIFLPLN